MSIVCNICENFKISKLICNCKDNREEDYIGSKDIEFYLLHSEQIKFNDLIPNNEIYLYFKIIKDETIISFAGESFIEIPLQEDDLLNKKLTDIKIYPVFFQDYIRPLFFNSIEKGEAYQFEFKTNMTERKLSCNLYPCSIPGMVSSCDIVIRYSHRIIEKGKLSQFAIKIDRTNSPGEKVSILY